MGVADVGAGKPHGKHHGFRVKTKALLKLLPADLETQASMQEWLDDNYTRLRDYLLNQLGRRIGDNTTGNRTEPRNTSSEVAPMDIGIFQKTGSASSCGPGPEWQQGRDGQ